MKYRNILLYIEQSIEEQIKKALRIYLNTFINSLFLKT